MHTTAVICQKMELDKETEESDIRVLDSKGSNFKKQAQPIDLLFYLPSAYPNKPQP